MRRKAKNIEASSLSDQQKRFCHEYLVDFNKAQAAKRAGYAKYTSEKNSSALFNLPQVQAYLLPLIEKMNERTLASATRVLEELSQIAISNLANYFKLEGEQWVMKDLNELTLPQQSVIAEFEPGVRIKLHNKDGALDKLAKHYKLYTDLEAGSAQFVMMPTLKISGKEVIFEVGKPAPQPAITKQKN